MQDISNFHIGIKEIANSQGGWVLKIIKVCDYVFGGLIAFCLPSKNKERVCQLRIKKILIIRPGGIGDAVFIWAILKKVKQLYSDISIDVLCQKRNQEIFLIEPGVVDHVFLPFDRRMWSRRYDLIIDSEQWHYFSGILAYFLKSKIRIGFATRPLRKKMYHRSATYEFNAYELINFKSLFHEVFPEVKEVVDIRKSIFLEDKNITLAQELKGREAVCVSLAGSIAARRFHQEDIRFMAEYFIHRRKSVVFVGGRDCHVESRFIEKNFSSEHVNNAIGKHHLKETADIIRSCCCLIGHDSGLIHLSEALGVPTIAIFGPGNEKKWVHPQGGIKVVSRDLPCMPCTVFGYTNPSACRKEYCCLSKTVERSIKYYEKYYS